LVQSMKRSFSKTRNSPFLFGLIVVGLLFFIVIVVYKTQRDRPHQPTRLQKMETIGALKQAIDMLF